MEISSEENIRLDTGYRYSELLVNILVDLVAAEKVLETMEDYSKIYRVGLQEVTVEHNIGKHAFYLPNNFVPVTKSRLKSMELENQEMKSNICTLNVELSKAKNMLAKNQPLVS